MLTYRNSDSLEIEGYSDADFAGHIDDRKSTSGYVFTLAGGVSPEAAGLLTGVKYSRVGSTAWVRLTSTVTTRTE